MWGDASAVGRLFLAVQALSFGSWLINKDKLTPEYTPIPFQMKLLWLTAILMTISGFTGTYPDWSWRWVSGFWKMTVFCFVLSKAMNTAEKVEKLYVVCLIVFSLLAMWGMQQKLGGNVRMEGLGGDVLPDVNSLAAVVVLYFPMTYYSILSTKKWIRLFIGIPTFILFVIFIMFGGSRGAFLGMSFCLMMFFLKAPGLQKFKMIFTFSILGVLLVIALSAIAPEGFLDEYTERLSTILGKKDVMTGEVEHEASAAGRTAMWKGAWVVYRNHPEYWVFGVGMYAYAQMYMRHIDEIAAEVTEEELHHILFGGSGGKEIHNTYISVLMGGGAAVLLCWLFLIFYAWFQVHRIPKKYPRLINGIDIHNYARAVEVGIMGYCVCIMFLNMEFIDLFYWHLIMSGVLVNLCKAKLQREALGQEDEEWFEESVGIPAYATRG